MWDFAYDGDGVRVATLTTPYDENGLPETPLLTAYYFGGMYEVTGSDVRKYYSFGGQTVAMKDGTGLQYFVTDHLGSIVAVTDASGTLISQQRYLPFGGVRSDVNDITQTDYGYTGQRNLDSGIGLMDYKARFYSPYINRFIQPDTIVPNPSNPQDLNRFVYVRNNPINYNDPSGHVICNDEGVCFTPPPNTGIVREDSGSTSSGGGGNSGSSGRGGNGGNPKQETIYMGGATPESVYHWQHFSDDRSDPFIDGLDEFVRIAKMLSPTAPPTLRVLLSYLIQESGDVSDVRITIVNGGEASATLERINMSEEARPSMTSCGITTNCEFIPLSPVSIDSGEIEIISICQNCLENRSTVYSHPFRPNKNNYIEVFMVLSMPINHGHQGIKQTGMPFIYTIPPR